MADRFWFARSRTARGYGRQVTPVSWEGWAVLCGFVAAMIGGGLAMLLLGLADRFALGIAIFVVLALAGAGAFLWAVAARSVAMEGKARRPEQ